MRALLGLLSLSLFFGPDADAKCAMMGLAPQVMTPTGAAIAKDGGILVGVIDERDGELETGDAAHQPGWRIKVGSQASEPKIVSLAPGLAVYKLPADAKDAVLIDHKRATIGSVTLAATAPAALVAPKIKKATYAARGGKRPFANLDIELDKAPQGGLAIVVTDAAGKPRSWGKLEAGKSTVRGFELRRCRVLPNGTIESKPGDQIKVFLVDASGRKSPLSNTAIVSPTKQEPDDD